VAKKGIYFFQGPEKTGYSDLSFYEFATQRHKKILAIQRPVDRLALSPDGRTILYPQLDESGSVLMLVENFR